MIKALLLVEMAEIPVLSVDLINTILSSLTIILLLFDFFYKLESTYLQTHVIIMFTLIFFTNKTIL